MSTGKSNSQSEFPVILGPPSSVRGVPEKNVHVKLYNPFLLAKIHNAHLHNKDTEKSCLGNIETYLIPVPQQSSNLFDYRISDNTS